MYIYCINTYIIYICLYQQSLDLSFERKVMGGGAYVQNIKSAKKKKVSRRRGKFLSRDRSLWCSLSFYVPKNINKARARGNATDRETAKSRITY